MVDKKLSEFSGVSTGGVSYFPILDNNTKNGKLAAAKAMRWSNCITEIPQDIKVELVTGGFTLKAGTIYYMPDGTAKQTTSDITKTTAVGGGTGFSVVCINEAGTGLRYRNLLNCVSGAGATTTGGFAYDTTTNKIGFYDSSGTMTSDDNSLPIMILETDSSGKAKSIYKLFNGVGYIGHHAFVLPGISVFMAYGRNADGTLKSQAVTLTSLNVIEMDTSRKVLDLINSTSAERSANWYEVETYNDIKTNVGVAKQYVKSDNRVYIYNSGTISSAGRTLLARISYNGTSVTQFDVEPVVSMATKRDLDEYVKTTGDQEISGAKTFSDTLRLRASFGSPIAWRLDDTNNKGAIYARAYYTASAVFHRMLAENTTSGKSAYLDIKAKDDGTSEFSLGGTSTLGNHNASSSKTSGLIATTGFVNDPEKSTNVVHRDGTETITGSKTFSGNNAFTGTNTVPTPTDGDSSGLVANTAFVQRSISANGATPRDVTTLWSNPSGSGSGTMNLSEPFTNFEKIGVYFGKDNLQAVTVYVQDTYWLNRILTNSSHDVMIATLGDASWSIKNYSDSTPSTTTKFVAGHESGVLFYIYGINRISS